jgi:hypothetical protein
MTTQQNNNDFNVSLQDIEALYKFARTKGLSMEGVLTYTYFFSGSTLSTIKNFAKSLKSEKFVIARIFPINKGKDFVMELKRKESHTPQTLYDLGNRLAQLSSNFAVEYEGYEADVYMPSVK